MEKEIWYIDFPTYRYKQDVKKLAREKGLKIVDSRFRGDAEQCKTPPKLDLKPEYEAQVKI